MKSISFNEEWYLNGERVTLPHDAQILEERGSDVSNGGHGYFPGGIYVYDKCFSAPAEWEDKVVLVEFEGVYKNAAVRLNGTELAFHTYGYTGFFVELKGLKYDQENTISVTADNSKLPNSRWYSGSGIYRPVWLHICDKEGIKPESICITTVSLNPAVVRFESPVYIRADVDGITGEGKNFEITIPDARLWSETDPYMYTARIEASPGDVTEIPFGIRIIKWSSKGLYINGKETLLRGGCIHHDNGILGAVTYAESEERRVRIMKENGFNAIRSAHNPASKALLDACDRYGMYVMDETFDMWYNRKNPYDYGADFESCWEEDTLSMIKRDYNHPCVVAYSIGNEVAEPAEFKGLKTARRMIDLCHENDSSRPVTCGTNLMILSKAAKGKGIYQDGEQKASKDRTGKENEGKNASLMFNIIASVVGTSMNKSGNSKKADSLSSPFLDMLDIAGYNYGSGRYPLEEKCHPDRAVIGTETFPQDICKNWDMVKRYPYVIGDFMWTAWDYLGEAGLGAWSYTGGRPFNRPYPWILSGAGVIDILGNPDGSCKYAKTVWGLEEKPVIAVRPVNHPGVRVSKSVWRGTNAILSWSFSGCDGNTAEIEVYSDQSYAELFLNGKKLGKKELKECKAVFKAHYEPGRLEAVVYDGHGAERGRNVISSAKGPYSIVIRPEKTEASPGEIIYVPVNIEGENGIVESNADRLVNVKVEGGELLAFGSANPCTEEKYHSGSFTTFYGRALAIVRGRKRGILSVRAYDENSLAEANIIIK